MERNVKLGNVIASLLWGGAVVFTVAGTLIAFVAGSWEIPLVLFVYGLLLTGAGSTVTVRNVLERQNHLLQDAFVMGQETGSQLRRVP